MRKSGTDRPHRRQRSRHASDNGRERPATAESLERRRLLSGSPPVASDDAFSVPENTTLFATGQTSLSFNGNGYIYAGTHTWTPVDGRFTATAQTYQAVGNVVTVTFEGGADDWTLNFAAPQGQVLTAGITYAGATRYPFQSPTGPGLDVSGDGRGSDDLTGQFTVLQATYNADGSVNRFAASFQQLNENNPSDALNGTVYYDYVPAGAAVPGVLGNDTDPDGHPLTARLVTGPAHGTLTLAPNGSFTYAPATAFAGTDSFTYVANDGTADSAVATARVVVRPVNQPPTFLVGPDQTANAAGGPQTVHGWATAIAPGPANESAQHVSFVITGDTGPGLFDVPPAVSPDGTLTYTPDAGASGTATVSVVAHDDGGTASGGNDASVAQSFVITVTPADHPPVAADDRYDTPAGTPLVVGPTAPLSGLRLDSDGNYIFSGDHTWTTADGGFAAHGSATGVVFSFTGANYPTGDYWTVEFVAPANQLLIPGTYVDAQRYGFESPGNPGFDVSGDGRGADAVSAQFTVAEYDLNADGSVATLAATFQDGTGPSALYGTVLYGYFTPSGVLANDTDPDDPDGRVLSAQLVSGPAHGTLSLNADGSFSYAPAAGFTGTDSFTYRASDSLMTSGPATVTLRVGLPPLPDADAGGPYEVAEGGTVALSAVDSTDPAGTIASYEWDLDYDGTTFVPGATGSTVPFAAGSLDGPSRHVVAVRVTDAGGLSDVATAVVSITDAPPTGFLPAAQTVLGSAATVAFTDVTDPSADDVTAGFTYSFDLDGDGTFDVVGSTSPSVTVPASDLATVGPHTVHGRVTDRDGQSTDRSTTVTVLAPATPTPTPTPTPTSTSPLVPTMGRTTLPAHTVAGVAINKSVRVTVTNRGTSTATGTDVVSLLAVGSDGTETTVATSRMSARLSADGSAAVAMKVRALSLPAGTYDLLARVTDATGAVSTGPVGRSVTVAAAIVRLSANLTGLTAARAAAALPGRPVVVTVRVTNTGTITATGPVAVDAYLSADGAARTVAVPRVAGVPRALRIGVGSTVSFRLALTVPADAAGLRLYPLIALALAGAQATAIGTVAVG